MSETPLKQATEAAIIPKSYFQGHECHVPADKLSEFRIRYSNKCLKFILDLTTVRSDDVRARILFKSYAALCAEKYRHFKHYPLSIHPYSKLRLYLELVFVFAIILSNTMLPIHFSETVPRITSKITEYIMYAADILMMVNIFANFFTGFVKGKTYKYVVLNHREIFCHYIKTWFIVDLASTISTVPMVLGLINNATPHIILVALKLFRLPVLCVYMSNIMKAFKVGVFAKTVTELLVYVYLYIFWNMFFQFAVEYIIEESYVPTNPRNCSWITIGNLWNETAAVRFIYAFERAVNMLRSNSKLNRIPYEQCNETFYTIAWLTSRILTYHCGIKYVIAAYGQESAAAKYFIMTKQIEMYMNQRKLPPRIKKKILKFYTIRYQGSFFVETHLLNCVSGQLREDIIMHTGRQLVREVEFLKQMPRTLLLQIGSKLQLVIFIAGDIIYKINTLRGDNIMRTGRQLVRELEFLKQMPRTLLLQIGSKLQLVIFIAGDIIYKINTVGDCLYFIDKGTVAIYSESGKEISHLEDGDFFGENALVMKHRFRTVSVVAVTNCELFRLDREDFHRSIACYPTVYEHIKKVATQRYEKVCVLDENHKTEMKHAEFEHV